MYAVNESENSYNFNNNMAPKLFDNEQHDTGYENKNIEFFSIYVKQRPVTTIKF